MIKKGERYRTKRPLKVIAMTSWVAPYTGGAHALLPAGEEFIVSNDPVQGAKAVYCDPVRYEELHSRFVSTKDRKNNKYCGYYLCIQLAAIRRSCDHVHRKRKGEANKGK